MQRHSVGVRNSFSNNSSFNARSVFHPPHRQRPLQPQKQRGSGPVWLLIPVALSVPGSVVPSSRASSRTRETAEIQAAGRPLPPLLACLTMRATRAPWPSSWCSLWPWPHSSSAGSTWLTSTSLTTSCDYTHTCSPPPPLRQVNPSCSPSCTMAS